MRVRKRLFNTIALAYHKVEASGKANTKHSPICVLHGLFGSKQNYKTVSKVLARDTHRDVYSIDLRNHGESEHVEPHSYKAMAADVERFIEDHRLHQPVLLGHSM